MQVGLFASVPTQGTARTGPITPHGEVRWGLTRRRLDPGGTQVVAREGSRKPPNGGREEVKSSLG